LSLCALTQAATSFAADPPLKKLELIPGLTARITTAGSLVFGEGETELLMVDLAPPGDARRIRNHDGAVFGAVSHEGAPGGRRGYSESADDDGDGLVDEDVLDGRDNDGDGRIDEDFAAVGDAMVAFHLSNGPAGRPIHLEYYNWAHVHLRSAVFLAATGRPDLVDAGSLRVATGGSDWLEIVTPGRSAAGPGHPALPGGRAYVSRVILAGPGGDKDDCGPTGSFWLGVRALEPLGDDPIRVSGSRLDVELSHEATPLVFAAAESRQQLIRILDQATAVPRGVTDPMTGRRTPWVAPALCAGCRQAEAGPMSWRTAEDGSLVLTVSRSGTHGSLPDPDLFAVRNGPLGTPDFIRWVPDDGTAFVVPWGCSGFDEGPGALIRFDLPEASGRVEYHFSGLDTTDLGDEVVGRFLDGRTLRTVLTSAMEVPTIGLGIAGAHRAPGKDQVDRAAAEFAEERARVLKAAEHQPTLSPDLLVGWPNPFRDQIQLRFQVPRTLEEAFVWKNPEDTPTGLDLQAAVPWSGGQPRVSVKIYSINGQELVTLESADLGAGEYTVQWNGADTYGRQVASGTYFCKLQLDEWSVTRRLVFIR